MTGPLLDRLDLGDVVLRHWTLADVPTLVRTVAESYDHLHPRMAWATPEGTSPEALTGFVRHATESYAAGTESILGIFDNVTDAPGDEGQVVLGSCGLHHRADPATIEIGYWLAATATGRGLATRIAEALTVAALARDDIERVEIRCGETNERSAAVARRAGFTLVGTVDANRALAPADTTGRDLVWARTRVRPPTPQSPQD